jgi:hypothetical protein
MNTIPFDDEYRHIEFHISYSDANLHMGYFVIASVNMFPRVLSYTNIQKGSQSFNTSNHNGLLRYMNSIHIAFTGGVTLAADHTIQ